jgi:hypothetical protein
MWQCLASSYAFNRTKDKQKSPAKKKINKNLHLSQQIMTAIYLALAQ